VIGIKSGVSAAAAISMAGGRKSLAINWTRSQ
jgi:hypothetical protein